MNSIKLSIDNKELDKALKAVNKELKDKLELHKGLSADIFSDVIDHFKKERGPNSRWERSIRAKLQGGRTLRDKGILVNSISPFAKKTQAGVQTSIQYARTHQFGKTIKARSGGLLKFKIGSMFVSKKEVTIPKREFFWASLKAINNMKKSMFEVLNTKWKKGK